MRFFYGYPDLKKDILVLLIELSKIRANKLLEIYSDVLLKKAEYETLDESDEVFFLEKEFAKILEDHKNLNDKHEFQDFEKYLIYKKKYILTGNEQFLIKLLEDYFSRFELTNYLTFQKAVAMAVYGTDDYKMQLIRYNLDDFLADLNLNLEDLLALLGGIIFQRHKISLIKEIIKGKRHEKIIANADKRKPKIQKLEWKKLFKNPKHADIIIGCLSEYLSATGDWITAPHGRYLVALCIVLEQKGYLITDKVLTNPIKAEAFAKKFNTTLSAKIFQPRMKEEAEGYTEFFNNIIPDYKPD